MITVLMTTYNDSKFLPYSIHTILNQTFKEFELLIIDDGSTDNTEELIKTFNDSRINYKKIEHSGRTKALNLGLKNATFDWVVLADADDLLYPEKIGIYKEYIHKGKNYIITAYTFHFSKKKIVYKIKFPSNINLKKFLALHAFSNSVLYNRNHILGLGGYNEELYLGEEDYELWLRAMNSSEFFVIPKYLTFTNHRADSISKSRIEERNNSIFCIQEPYYSDEYLINLGYKTETERIILKGWKEYFFGSKESAKEYFKNIGFNLIKSPRACLALLLTYLPERYLGKFKSSLIKLRLKYLIGYFSKETIRARKLLKKILSTHPNFLSTLR
jgi:glycosyltransferase involved in cell wall biosynthesis